MLQLLLHSFFPTPRPRSLLLVLGGCSNKLSVVVTAAARSRRSVEPTVASSRRRYGQPSCTSDAATAATTTATVSCSSFPPDTQVVLLSTVFPEPHATAAGVRTERLLQLLSQSPGVKRIHYLTTTTTTTTTTSLSSSSSLDASPETTKSSSSSSAAAAISEALHRRHETRTRLETQHGVSFGTMLPNQSKVLQDWISNNLLNHRSTNKNASDNVLVLFDRFYVEEMFSFQFHEHLGDKAALVLDMQDWHSLRKAREKVAVALYDHHQQQHNHNHQDTTMNTNHLLSTSHVLPDLNDFYLLRELASIQRSDLSLVCSTFERDLLQQNYGIQPFKLCPAPLLFAAEKAHQTTKLQQQRDKEPDSSWGDRKDLCFVGNFKHPPNLDAVQQLQRLWPLLRKQLPDDAQLHIYGAYYSGGMLLHTSKQPLKGFHLHGYCNDLSHVLSTCRLLVAPLRFGAGLKGKIVEAWKHGLPVVTTTIGSEGLVPTKNNNNNNHNSHKNGDESDLDAMFAGMTADCSNNFVAAVAKLYNNVDAWNKAQHKITSLLSRLGNGDDDVIHSLASTLVNRHERRKIDVPRAILWHTSQQSTKYLSKFIESRNRNSINNNLPNLPKEKEPK